MNIYKDYEYQYIQRLWKSRLPVALIGIFWENGPVALFKLDCDVRNDECFTLDFPSRKLSQASSSRILHCSHEFDDFEKTQM